MHMRYTHVFCVLHVDTLCRHTYVCLCVRVKIVCMHTAGIISLLTHICVCVVLFTLVHAQLTYGHQSPCK